MKSLETYINDTNDWLIKIETVQSLALSDSEGKIIAYDYACMLQVLLNNLRGEVDELVHAMATLKSQNQRAANPLQG